MAEQFDVLAHTIGVNAVNGWQINIPGIGAVNIPPSMFPTHHLTTEATRFIAANSPFTVEQIQVKVYVVPGPEDTIRIAADTVAGAVAEKVAAQVATSIEAATITPEAE